MLRFKFKTFLWALLLITILLKTVHAASLKPSSKTTKSPSKNATTIATTAKSNYVRNSTRPKVSKRTTTVAISSTASPSMDATNKDPLKLELSTSLIGSKKKQNTRTTITTPPPKKPNTKTTAITSSPKKQNVRTTTKPNNAKTTTTTLSSKHQNSKPIPTTSPLKKQNVKNITTASSQKKQNTKATTILPTTKQNNKATITTSALKKQDNKITTTTESPIDVMNKLYQMHGMGSEHSSHSSQSSSSKKKTTTTTESPEDIMKKLYQMHGMGGGHSSFSSHSSSHSSLSNKKITTTTQSPEDIMKKLYQMHGMGGGHSSYSFHSSSSLKKKPPQPDTSSSMNDIYRLHALAMSQSSSSNKKTGSSSISNSAGSSISSSTSYDNKPSSHSSSSIEHIYQQHSSMPSSMHHIMAQHSMQSSHSSNSRPQKTKTQNLKEPSSTSLTSFMQPLLKQLTPVGAGISVVLAPLLLFNGFLTFFSNISRFLNNFSQTILPVRRPPVGTGPQNQNHFQNLGHVYLQRQPRDWLQHLRNMKEFHELTELILKVIGESELPQVKN